MEEKGESAEPFAEAGEVDGERICEREIVCVLEFWDDPYDFILHDHVCPTHQLQMALIRARPIE